MQTKTFNLALPGDLLKKVDLTAKKEYRNRSELIREALRAYLKKKAEWQQFFTFSEQRAKNLGLKSSREIDKIVAEFRHGK